MNPVISTLAYWATRTLKSTTGKNVTNIRKEFSDPLTCAPQDICIKKHAIPEGGIQQIDLLARLLVQRSEEMDPDILPEIDSVIDNVCQERNS